MDQETRKRNLRIAEAYQAGKTLQEVGEEYGLGRERIRQIVARLGLSRRDGGAAKRAQALEDQAAQLLATGLNRKEVAEQLGRRRLQNVESPISQEEWRRRRFWARVDQSGGEAACWPWTGGIHTNGYGHLRQVGELSYLAHRRAYQYTHGTPPPGTVIRHTCDNRICCNPAHLVPGTQADNVKDRDSRGRGNFIGARRKHGETRALVLEHTKKGHTGRETSQALGVSLGVVAYHRARLREAGLL